MPNKNNFNQHYHCLICEEPYSTKAKAEKCFKNHSKEEHLIWIAKEVCYMKSYTYNLLKYIDFIDKKYKIYF